MPRLRADVEELSKVFDRRYWFYGVDANHTELEALTRYAHRQGIAIREVTVNELFATETLAISCA